MKYDKSFNTEFNYGIIKSCLARPDIFKAVQKDLDKIFEEWPVYIAVKECSGMSGKANELMHDIFYQVLKDKVPDAEKIVECINKQDTPHETLVNRVRLLSREQTQSTLISNTSSLLGVLRNDSKPLADRWQYVKQYCTSTMSIFNQEDYISEVSGFADTILQQITEQQDGQSTGYHTLDSITRGFLPGEFVLIGGAPSMGKTSFGINCAVNTSLNSSKSLFFSMEMTDLELMERVICMLSKVSMRAFKEKNFTRAQQSRVNGAIETIRSMNMKIISKGGLTPSDIAGYIETSFLGQKPDVVYIDYIQLMSDDEKSKDEYQKVTNISKSLKQIAMNSRVPIVAIAQLSRKTADHSRTHRPKMSDLKGSGSLEQDANKILLLYREDYYRRQENKTSEMDGRATLIVEKNRQGDCADLLYTWIPEFFLFREEGYAIHNKEEKEINEPEKEKEDGLPQASFGFMVQDSKA